MHKSSSMEIEYQMRCKIFDDISFLWVLREIKNGWIKLDTRIQRGVFHSTSYVGRLFIASSKVLQFLTLPIDSIIAAQFSPLWNSSLFPAVQPQDDKRVVAFCWASHSRFFSFVLLGTLTRWLSVYGSKDWIKIWNFNNNYWIYFFWFC